MAWRLLTLVCASVATNVWCYKHRDTTLIVFSVELNVNGLIKERKPESGLRLATLTYICLQREHVKLNKAVNSFSPRTTVKISYH